MILFPAIDMYKGNAVRLLRGDYEQVTVYHDRPEEVAAGFLLAGASNLHLVDLEGARDGGTPNYDTVLRILRTWRRPPLSPCSPRSAAASAARISRRNTWTPGFPGSSWARRR